MFYHAALIKVVACWCVALYPLTSMGSACWVRDTPLTSSIVGEIIYTPAPMLIELGSTGLSMKMYMKSADMTGTVECTDGSRFTGSCSTLNGKYCTARIPTITPGKTCHVSKINYTIRNTPLSADERAAALSSCSNPTTSVWSGFIQTTAALLRPSGDSYGSTTTSGTTATLTVYKEHTLSVTAPLQVNVSGLVGTAQQTLLPITVSSTKVAPISLHAVATTTTSNQTITIFGHDTWNSNDILPDETTGEATVNLEIETSSATATSGQIGAVTISINAA